MKAGAARSAVALAGVVAALAAGGGTAWAEVPPSEKVYPREQTWACGELGTFVTLYGSAGHWGTVKWLSRDGGRGDAVQVTSISGEMTLIFGEEVFHYQSREPAPRRLGQDQFRCDISAASEDGSVRISGWAVVGVVGSRGGSA